MDSKRAAEILQSPETIYVTYQNIPVWIDKLNEENQVTIHDMNSDTQMEVPVDELTEEGT